LHEFSPLEEILSVSFQKFCSTNSSDPMGIRGVAFYNFYLKIYKTFSFFLIYIYGGGLCLWTPPPTTLPQYSLSRYFPFLLFTTFMPTFHWLLRDLPPGILHIFTHFFCPFSTFKKVELVRHQVRTKYFREEKIYYLGTYTPCTF